MNIVALAREETMRLDRHLDQRVACRAITRRRRALAPKTQYLPLLDAGRDFHLQRAAMGKMHVFCRAIDRIEKVDRQLVVQIMATRIARLMRPTLEDFGENIVGAREVRIAGARFIGIVRRLGGVIPIIFLLRPFSAGGVDLAGVETATFLRIAQQIIG